MAYEQKDMSGSIFKNNRKEKDTHPDLSGTALIDGHEYWVSGWKKKDRNGDTFVSLSFRPKEPMQSIQRSPEPKPILEDDEIPF